MEQTENQPRDLNPQWTNEPPLQPQQPKEPAPITPESVVSKPTEDRPAPDSSILSTRIDKMFQKREQAPQSRQEPQMDEASSDETKRILRALAQLQTGSTEPQEPGPEMLIRKLQTELEQIKQSQETLQGRLAQEREQAELQEAQREVTAWVEAQGDAYPLLNKLKQGGLVFQKIYNTRQQTGRVISEAQAASEINEELGQIVDQLAPLRGYTRREGGTESDAPKRDEQISLTMGGMSISEPADRDKMTADDYFEYVLKNK